MLKILVAEDDHNLAHYYKTLLSQWNCETVIEHTGTDAIRQGLSITKRQEPFATAGELEGTA